MPDDSTIAPVRRLEGWVTLQQAGAMLGYSKQGIGQAVLRSPNPLFDLRSDVRAIGDRRLFYLVRETAVRAEIARRTAEAGAE